MQKPPNEHKDISWLFGTQLRYVSTRRIRALRARARRNGQLLRDHQGLVIENLSPDFQYRHINGKLWSWLRALPKE